ncbi:MAG: hypothetical protein ACTS2F_24745 [Thainema sp.]
MHLRNINVMVRAGGGALAWVAILMGQSAQAHKTEVSGDVAGTWHIEPNHSPKAGEPARVWIALTQQGGQIIPLEQCDCQLTIYRNTSSSADSAPVLKPSLEAVSPENYQSIPGADVVFPEVGEYRIELTGSPQAGATFTPFELSYTTVVAAGRAPQTTASSAETSPTGGSQAEAPADGSSTATLQADAPSDRPLSNPTGLPSSGWLIGAGIGVAIALIIFAAFFLRHHQVSK